MIIEILADSGANSGAGRVRVLVTDAGGHVARVRDKRTDPNNWVPLTNCTEPARHGKSLIDRDYRGKQGECPQRR